MSDFIEELDQALRIERQATIHSISEIAKLRAENKLLKERCEREMKRVKAMQEFVAHRSYCPLSNPYNRKSDCLCGLSDALKGWE